jgi:hypothetical protein
MEPEKAPTAWAVFSYLISFATTPRTNALKKTSEI